MTGYPASRLSQKNDQAEADQKGSAEGELAPRILIVDDEEHICDFLSELFKLEGWEVDVAYDGYQGVMLASDTHYDAIIMDILMPRMTGIEATREIIKRKPESKIIVITGAPYKKQAQEALVGGAKLIIKKPFLSATVIEAVKSAITESK